MVQKQTNGKPETAQRHDIRTLRIARADAPEGVTKRMPHSHRKVIVAVSAGVDSSVAAALVAKQYEAIAVHFTKFDLPGLAEDVRERDEAALEAAKQVASALAIPFRAVEVGGEFDKLVDFFCDEYNSGRTPNPCVVCNRAIRWPALMGVADEEGAHFVATGHYARLEKRGGCFHLVRPRERRKDQTYFLHRLTQEHLSRTLFPLSGTTKEEVRDTARKLGLPGTQRPESQEICFVPPEGYSRILKDRTPEKLGHGHIIDPQGHVLGDHKGYQFYTIGQRKGLAVALGRRAYVVNIDPRSGNVTLADEEALETRRVVVQDVNWISGPPPAEPFEAIVRIRYNHPGAEALVTPTGGAVRIDFTQAVRAATPGQAAVFYLGEEVVGGGWIAGKPARGGAQAEFA
ncbi:MAG: tRNA 2-thiouridine(34) synthase MnmA [Planctomycetes bacterium]|nr:tRNA 2-thiouridine(34) synthase MnmA [Planctomycetota bacterium]